MKINILYQFTDNPWGGGNQFLKAIKKKFVKRNIYTNKISNANVAIVNSHQIPVQFFFIYLLKKNFKIIHRIDGPISLTRNSKFKYIDKTIHLFSKTFADGIVFQSKWSKEKNIKIGLDKNIRNTIINNAPDNNIFFKKKKINKSKKINIISSSWSSNIKKGFKFIKYLDDKLNFKKFNMIFVGNSPIEFKNIKVIPPVKSKKLSKLLSKNDYFFTASRDDPCSNSLLEALSCGLIPIYIDSGGHKEITNNQGIIFKNKKDLIKKLKNLSRYRQSKNIKIDFIDIENKTNDYLIFINKLKINKINTAFKLMKILNFLFRIIYLRLIYKFNF